MAYRGGGLGLRTALLLGVGVASVFDAASWAQTTPVASAAGQPAGTQQQLNPSARVSAQPRRSPDIFSGPIQSPCPPQFTASKAQVTLAGVDVTGASVLHPDDLGGLFADMTGRPVPIGAACEIRDRLANLLFQRGVLARVEIPAQKLAATGGRLRLEVIEARISAVRYHAVGNVGPAQGKVEAYLERLRGLAPFTLDTAQRYLLLANEVPGMQVSAALVPSTGAEGPVRGGIDLDVSIRRRPVDVIVTSDNDSSSSLGPWSLLVRGDLNSATRLGERTTLIGYGALNRNEQQVLQLVEEARPTSTGLFVRGSVAYGWSHPGGVLAPLKLDGQSLVGSGEVDYPLVFLARKKLTVAGGFDFIDQKTVFPGGGVLSNDSLRVVWLKSDAFGRHDFDAPTPLGYISTTGNLSVQVRKGIDALGASIAGAPDLSRVGGRSNAVVGRLDALGAVAFQPVRQGIPGLNLSLHVQGEYADRAVLAYEEQAVGNYTIGRGYDPNALSGGRFIGAEVKAETTQIPFALGFSLAPYGFLDEAKVANLQAGSTPQTVRSLGGGAEFQLFTRSHYLPYGLRVDALYAQPLDKTSSTALSKPPPRVLLQVIAPF